MFARSIVSPRRRRPRVASIFATSLLLGLVFSVFFGLSSCREAVVVPDAPPTAYDSDKFDADPLATLWFDCAVSCAARSKGFTEPVSARTYAYLSIAMYEALRPGMPVGYRSLSSQLLNFSALPQPDTAGKRFHWTLCANAAAADLMRGIFVNSGAAVKNSIDSLEQLCYTERFERTYDTAMSARSVAYGKAVAKAVLTYAEQDGGKDADKDNFAVPFTYTGDSTAWTLSSVSNPLLAAWGKNRACVLTDNDLSTELDPGPYPAFSTEKNSDFYKTAAAVRSAVLSMSGDERSLVAYWGNEGQSAQTVSSHLVSILSQLLRTRACSLGQSVIAYTKISLAMNDACIAVWHYKYKYPLLRPVQYIATYVDKSWQSDPTIAKIYVPTSPEYVSTSAALCASALPTFESFFGADYLFTDRSRMKVVEMERDYYNFDQIQSEILRTQQECGIQYPFSISAGTTLGSEVAARVAQRVQFAP